MKRLFAWFKRKNRNVKSPIRSTPAHMRDEPVHLPEFAVMAQQDVDVPEQAPVQTMDTSWQPPVCEAPSFDTSSSFAASAPSSCDVPTSYDP